MIGVQQDFPLTCGQRWLLYLLEQSPGQSRPVQRVYRLSNSIDTAALLEAMEHVIAIHPALRMRLVKKKNGWMQRFPAQDVNITGEEIQGCTPEMRAAYASMLVAEEAKTTLDLTKGPPVKAKIIKIDDDHLLSLCIDHLAADEMAFDIFEHALVSSYQQLMDGQLLPAVQQNSFFSYLPREIAQQQVEEKNLLYWQQQLKDMHLHGDTTDELKWTPASVFEYDVTGQSLQSLLNFCKAHRCSLFNVMVAAQLLILSQAANVHDIVLNIPVSNRPRAEDRSIIANLSMLLHVRFNVIQGESASTLVVRVRDQLLNAMAHRQYDYPSLSRFVAAEAAQHGTNASWLLGCNYVIEQMQAVFPNALFAERLDNLPGRIYDIPLGSFTVASRQSASNLHVLIDWDANAWPVAVDDMKIKFESILQEFML
jgi:hypothetical protein